MPASNVVLGAHFEQSVLRVLSQTTGAELILVGGARDRGVDLRGSWDALDCRLVIQCKYSLTNRICGPAVFRLMQHAIESEQKQHEHVVLGIVAAGAPLPGRRFSHEALFALNSLPVPVMGLGFVAQPLADVHLAQAVLNPPAMHLMALNQVSLGQTPEKRFVFFRVRDGVFQPLRRTTE